MWLRGVTRKITRHENKKKTRIWLTWSWTKPSRPKDHLRCKISILPTDIAKNNLSRGNRNRGTSLYAESVMGKQSGQKDRNLLIHAGLREYTFAPSREFYFIFEKQVRIFVKFPRHSHSLRLWSAWGWSQTVSLLCWLGEWNFISWVTCPHSHFINFFSHYLFIFVTNIFVWERSIPNTFWHDRYLLSQTVFRAWWLTMANREVFWVIWFSKRYSRVSILQIVSIWEYFSFAEVDMCSGACHDHKW